MARYKKRKSKPTAGAAGPKKVEKQPGEGSEPPPPVDDAAPESPTREAIEPPPKPKKEQVLTDAESAESKRKLDTLFWLRVGLAVAAGTAATFLFEGIEDFEERRWTSIGFMIAVFIVSVVIGKMMRIRLAPSDRKKLVTNGIGSFVFIYLFMWILTYTLAYSSDTGGLSTPII